jgi:transposase-like protein
MVLQLFVAARPGQRSCAGCLGEDDVRIFVAGSTELYEEVASTQQRSRFTYRVKSGDTISRLARRYGMSEGLIARINHVSPRDELEPGRELVLYVDSARPARPAPRAKRQDGGGTAEPGAAVSEPSTPRRGPAAPERAEPSDLATP